MKLYTFSAAPNPKRVELFLAEKQLQIPRETIDLMQREQLAPEFQAKNPNCDVPLLELDDGTCISQVPAIVSYLEETYPARPMFGSSPQQKAQVIMWEHILFCSGLHGVADVLRNSSERFKGRALVGPHNYDQIPALAERGRLRTRHFFVDLNRRLEDSEYVAGDFFSMADISAWVICQFAGWIEETVPDEMTALIAWRDKVSAREAFKALGE